MMKHYKAAAALIAAVTVLTACGCGNTIEANDLESLPTASVTSEERSFGSKDNLSENEEEITTVTTTAVNEPETEISSEVTSESETETETTTTTEETTTTTTTTITTTTTTTTTTAKPTETTTTTTKATTTTTAATKNESNPSVEVDGESKFDSFYQSDNTKALYKNFSQEEINLIKQLTFVGDSVCSGLKVYKYMPTDQVLAEGCAAPWNIFDVHTMGVNVWFHYYGQATDFKSAYKAASPKIVICSMGINEVNISSTENYVKNYLAVCDWMKSVTPDAKIFICSITPTNNSGFSMTKINANNKAMLESKERISKGYGYLDIGTGLNSGGYLNSKYSGGDGIHLMPSAYEVILKQVCNQIL